MAHTARPYRYEIQHYFDIYFTSEQNDLFIVLISRAFIAQLRADAKSNEDVWIWKL